MALRIAPFVYGERAHLKSLGRHGPSHLVYHHYRRLICTGYWCRKTLLWWFADQVLQALPPPDDGILYLVGDNTLNGKRGPKHPDSYGQQLAPPRVLGLCKASGVYRIPIDFALGYRKSDPGYHPENVLCGRAIWEISRRCSVGIGAG